MRKLFTSVVIAMVSATAWAFEMQIEPAQTGQIVVSNNPAAPTQLFTNDSAAMRTYIVNTSSNVIYIVGMSTSSANPTTTPSPVSVSLTTGSFVVAGGTTTFSPDGQIDPYRGPLWGVAGGTGGTVIQRFRAK